MIGSLPEQKEAYLVRVVFLKRTTGPIEGKVEEIIDVANLKEFAPEHKDLAESMFNLVVGVGQATYESTEMVFSAVNRAKEEREKLKDD